MRRVIVVGAGAAGLMAACAAADAGAQVTVLEGNEKAGKKLYITGKGRGNYTNACETADFFRSVLRNPKFLYSAVYGFDSAAMTRFLENNGCPTKMERGQRCFPASDHAYDLTDALVRHLKSRGGRIRLHSRVRRILTEEPDQGEPNESRKPGECAGAVSGELCAPVGRAQGTSGEPRGSAENALGASGESRKPVGRAQRVSDLPRNREECTRRVLGVETDDGKRWTADAVIIATGGVSYPSTGSTGDGYRFARELGLQVMDPQPSLVPLMTAEDWPCQLQGLSLKNVAVKVEELPEKAEELAGKESMRLASAETAAAQAAGPANSTGGGNSIGSSSGTGGSNGPGESSTGNRGRGSGKGQKERKKHGKSRPVYEGFGEMLFTHFGVSGPLILSASCHTDFAAHPEGYLLHLDLKPALSAEELTARLQREFEAAPGKELRSVLRTLLPQRLAEEMAEQFCRQWGQSLSYGANGGSLSHAGEGTKSAGKTGCSAGEEKETAERRTAPVGVAGKHAQERTGPVGREMTSAGTSRTVGRGISRDAPVRTLKEKDVKALADLLKDVTMHLVGTRGFGEAIVTRGGVSVKEINPSTMETRRSRGLYWAGEVIDVDAYTGGYNLQIAWSTGHLAGENAARAGS